MNGLRGPEAVMGFWRRGLESRSSGGPSNREAMVIILKRAKILLARVLLEAKVMKEADVLALFI